MFEVIQYILEEGPKFGYKMSLVEYKMSLVKGAYLLGKCGSFERACERKKHLVEVIGLSESIVKIYPDDAEDYGVAALEYGMAMLGAYVGCDEFVKRKLEEHVLSLEPVVERCSESFSSAQKLLLSQSEPLTSDNKTRAYW